MNPPLFVDTNVICALYNSTDSLYQKAQKIKPLLAQYNLVISNFVLLETYTILSQRISKQFSIDFGTNVYKDRVFKVVWINKKLEQTVWKIFASVKDKNFSYVDASILAVLQKEKIRHLLSFDQSFESLQKEYHFKLIPT